MLADTQANTAAFAMDMGRGIERIIAEAFDA
jgi:hypothetical protein